MLGTSVYLKEGVVETGNNDSIGEIKMYDFIHHLFYGFGESAYIISSTTGQAREDDDSDEELYSTSHYYAFTSKYTRIDVIISFLEAYYLVTGSIILCSK